jgi:hypothetical protein
MNARLVRTKAKGQTLPLIALVIVVVIAMVGLAVDVGNTYAQQRNTVRSSNAAALAGMGTLLRNGADGDVHSAIVASLKSNGIEVPALGASPGPGQRELVARYLDASGNPIAACPTIGTCSGTKVSTLGVTYINVEVKGKVDTFFARVVNANTLPVGANAWAARGACSNGVYPFTIRDDFLTTNGWVQPATPYSDSTYKGRTLKRVYMKQDSGPPGGFSWVRWKSDKNAGDKTELEAMLTGDGNIDERFDEVKPWPANSNRQEPDGYPIEPGRLNADEWIYGNPGVSAGSGVKAQLDYHIQYRTEMILPIHDEVYGTGNNATYHVSRLGSFLLRGYNLNGQGYLDLVYLGDAAECPKLITPPSRTINPGLAGQVFFRPRHMYEPQSRPPIAYLIIQDVTGSMSWTFDGKGWNHSTGKAVQCTGSASAGCSGPSNYWPDYTKRRIYTAKNALNAFVDQMQPNDIMRIVSFSGSRSQPNNQAAINELTDLWPAEGWSSDKTKLKDSVKTMGSYKGDQWKTDGRTSSATGIASATQEWGRAPKTDPTSGQEYKRVAIFITDGVANVFRDGTVDDNKAAGCGTEVASCHVGYVEGTNPPKPRAITAMIIESDNLKDLSTVYVIALSELDETGLKNVASAANFPYFSTSKNGTDLQGIFQSIATNVKYGDCVPVVKPWENEIKEEQVGDVAPRDGGPLTYPTVGKAYLYDQNGNVLPGGKGVANITANGESLSFLFNDLTPGTYQLRAFVAYRGEDDISRIYKQIYNPNTSSIDNTITVNVDPTNALGTVVAAPPMYLDMDGSVCP